MQKIAIFDFCNTIINFHSANYFVDFVRIRHATFLNQLLPILDPLFKVCVRLKLITSTKYKSIKVFFLKGIRVSDIENIINEYKYYLITCENRKVVEKINWHKKRGDFLVIASGGYSIYLEKYAKEKKIDKIIATDLEIKKGKFTGFIKGADCMGEEKVKKLMQTLNIEKYNLNDSYVYSDDLSDKLIFDLVGNRVFVSSKNIPKLVQQDSKFTFLINE